MLLYVTISIAVCHSTYSINKQYEYYHALCDRKQGRYDLVYKWEMGEVEGGGGYSVPSDPNIFFKSLKLQFIQTNVC